MMPYPCRSSSASASRMCSVAGAIGRKRFRSIFILGFRYIGIRVPCQARPHQATAVRQPCIIISSMSPVLARPTRSHFRWNVCALLFFATTINYVDRQVLSILAKTLETKIGWDSIQYGYITAASQAAYAIGLLMAGRLMDRLGTRKGYALAITVWSLAAMAHAAAVSAFTFGIARALLGFGEAANFPACIKTVAEWFPKKERALATGIFNSGANIGAVVV